MEHPILSMEVFLIKVIKWLDHNLEEFILTLCLVLMTLIMGIQVCARYVFNSSLSWTEEITRYLFVWSGFISISYCTRKCISIKIEQFIMMFSQKTQTILKIVNHIIELGFFFYMFPFAIRYLKLSIECNQVSTALGIPMYFVQVAPLVGFFLVIIRIIQRLVIEISNLRRR